MESRKRNQYDTIIIGAGMSGLACAAKLLDHPSYGENTTSTEKPHKKLLVLEARGRVGGRIGSVVVNGNRLDTGANWIHGVGTEEKPNPLMNILPKKQYRELGASVRFRVPSNTKTQEMTITPTVDGTGKAIVQTPLDNGWVQVDAIDSSSSEEKHGEDLVITPEISQTLSGALWGLIGSLHEKAAGLTAEEAKHTSLLQTIMHDKDFVAAFESLPEEYHASLASLPQFVENMEAGPLGEASASSDPAATAGLGQLEYAIDDFEGDQVFLHDGYTALIEEIGQRVINEGHVKLSSAVERVNWAGDLVQVFTRNETFVAKRVICTLPLGVLQHDLATSASDQAPKLFSPPLPPAKIEAISSLGFGTLDKVFLVYSNPWWTEDPWSSILRKGLAGSPFPPNMAPITGDDVTEPDAFWGFTTELQGIAILPNSSHPVAGPRSLSLINLHALTGFPVLSCFVSCANALHIESLSDADAGSLVHRALATWLGREPPAPDAVHVTRWAKDEYSRGSYTHMVTGLSERRHREEFAKPILNAKGAELRWAGEHTSEDHFATVHGALLSGWREAEAVLRSEMV